MARLVELIKILKLNNQDFKNIVIHKIWLRDSVSLMIQGSMPKKTIQIALGEINQHVVNQIFLIWFGKGENACEIREYNLYVYLRML